MQSLEVSVPLSFTSDAADHPITLHKVAGATLIPSELQRNLIAGLQACIDPDLRWEEPPSSMAEVCTDPAGGRFYIESIRAVARESPEQ